VIAALPKNENHIFKFQIFLKKPPNVASKVFQERENIN
jgi:hypothetical protein